MSGSLMWLHVDVSVSVPSACALLSFILCNYKYWIKVQGILFID